MWIFGYGSLVWKADFPYVQKIVGYVKGYERKFWQASVDHRGDPENPGRVVTLVPSTDPEAQVWGVCYEIDDNETKYIQALLVREKSYRQEIIHFYPIENDFKLKLNNDEATTIMSINNNDRTTTTTTKATLNGNGTITLPTSKLLSFKVHVFIGAPVLALDPTSINIGENESLEKIAQTIASAKGPSGSNTDYLFKLAAFMRLELPHANDQHLFDLEKRVLEIIEEKIQHKNQPTTA